MAKANYGFSKTVEADFETTLKEITEALHAQSFGILTTTALNEEIEIGLLLPCNVIVYNKDGKTHVAVIRPSQAMQMIKKQKLEIIAADVEEKLKIALQSI